MTVSAGKVYRSRRRRVRIEQVRGRSGPGLGYALTRCVGRPSQYLRDLPITIQLMPDGSMPPGYQEVPQ